MIHIAGSKYLFSCYDVGDLLLAFYTLTEDAPQTIDTDAADKQIERLVVTELRELLPATGGQVQESGGQPRGRRRRRSR